MGKPAGIFTGPSGPRGGFGPNPGATQEIGRSEAGPAVPVPRPLVELSGATVSGLNTVAMRTTVPASEASRRGAGAAASDND